MTNFNLAKALRELKDFKNDPVISFRLKVIIFSYQNCATKASQVFSISRMTVYRFRDIYAKKGVEGLNFKRKYLKNHPQFELVKNIVEKYASLSKKEIAYKIYTKTGMIISHPNIHKILKKQLF